MPIRRIKSAEDFKAARDHLGMSMKDIASLMYLPNPHKDGEATVRRWEGRGTRPLKDGPPGPARMAMEALLSGWRPAWWEAEQAK